MLYKHPCSVFAFALTCAVVFIMGARHYGFADTVFWGCVTVVAAIGLFPPQPKTEPYEEARGKALRGLAGDKAVWLGFFFLLYLAAQALNSGRALGYDIGSERWVFLAPPWRLVPSSVDSGAAWRMCLAFFPAAAIAVCARHGMTPGGRLVYLSFLACLSAGVAAWEFGAFAALGGQTDGWRVFADADQGGVWFLLGFCVSVALWARARLEKQHARASVLFFLCAFSNLLGVWASRAPAAWLLLGCAGLPLAFLTLALAWKSAGWRWRAAVVVFILALPALMFFHCGMDALQSAGFEGSLREMVFAGRAEKAGVAWQIWRDNRVFGVGGGNYPWYTRQIQEYAAGGLSAQNDFAQFFAEFGVAGISLAAAMMLLFGRSARRWWAGAAFARKGLYLLFNAGTALVFAAAWVGSPFRSPPVLLSVAAALACASAFLQGSQNGDDVV